MKNNLIKLKRNIFKIKDKSAKYIVFGLVLCMMFSFIPISALDSNNVVEEIEWQTISEDEIPEGIVPVEFDSMDEANEYFNNINIEVNMLNENELNNIQYETATRSSQVQTKLVLYGDYYGVTKLNLYIKYSTSIPNNGGYITYIHPYTTLTGLTLGVEWKESATEAIIDSSGKDAYVYTTGTMDFYILVNGIFKFFSEDIDMGRTVYLCR